MASEAGRPGPSFSCLITRTLTKGPRLGEFGHSSACTGTHQQSYHQPGSHVEEHPVVLEPGPNEVEAASWNACHPPCARLQST